MENLVDIIKEKAKSLLPEMIAIRQHLHSHPELSFEEYETSAFIQNKLKYYDIPFETGWVRTGLIATTGKQKDFGNTIALRADLDALPISEANEVSYKSKNEGVMHACGHDVHSTCLLGALVIIRQLNLDYKNRLIGIFQPGEEKLPGGAQLMIQEGLISQYQPEMIAGLHVLPQLETGKLGFCPGKSMASSDEIYITVKGKGGHAAQPHLCIDPILVTANILSNLQKIVSRKADPLVPSVLSFGKINSEGGATNVIPDEVKLEGTFRTMDEHWRLKAHQLIIDSVKAMAHADGSTAEVEIRHGYPTLINNHKVFDYCEKASQEYLSNENVPRIPPRMTAEDFAYYSQQIPSCFFRLGTGNKERNICSSVHTSTFDIDENAIEIGMGALAYLAVGKLL